METFCTCKFGAKITYSYGTARYGVFQIGGLIYTESGRTKKRPKLIHFSNVLQKLLINGQVDHKDIWIDNTRAKWKEYDF